MYQDVVRDEELLLTQILQRLKTHNASLAPKQSPQAHKDTQSQAENQAKAHDAAQSQAENQAKAQVTERVHSTPTSRRKTRKASQRMALALIQQDEDAFRRIVYNTAKGNPRNEDDAKEFFARHSDEVVYLILRTICWAALVAMMTATFPGLNGVLPVIQTAGKNMLVKAVLKRWAQNGLDSFDVLDGHIPMTSITFRQALDFGVNVHTDLLLRHYSSLFQAVPDLLLSKTRASDEMFRALEHVLDAVRKGVVASCTDMTVAEGWKVVSSLMDPATLRKKTTTVTADATPQQQMAAILVTMSVFSRGDLSLQDVAQRVLPDLVGTSRISRILANDVLRHAWVDQERTILERHHNHHYVTRVVLDELFGRIYTESELQQFSKQRLARLLGHPSSSRRWSKAKLIDAVVGQQKARMTITYNLVLERMLDNRLRATLVQLTQYSPRWVDEKTIKALRDSKDVDMAQRVQSFVDAGRTAQLIAYLDHVVTRGILGESLDEQGMINEKDFFNAYVSGSQSWIFSPHVLEALRSLPKSGAHLVPSSPEALKAMAWASLRSSSLASDPQEAMRMEAMDRMIQTLETPRDMAGFYRQLLQNEQDAGVHVDHWTRPPLGVLYDPTISLPRTKEECIEVAKRYEVVLIQVEDLDISKRPSGRASLSEWQAWVSRLHNRGAMHLLCWTGEPKGDAVMLQREFDVMLEHTAYQMEAFAGLFKEPMPRRQEWSRKYMEWSRRADREIAEWRQRMTLPYINHGIPKADLLLMLRRRGREADASREMFSIAREWGWMGEDMEGAKAFVEASLRRKVDKLLSMASTVTKHQFRAPLTLDLYGSLVDAVTRDVAQRARAAGIDTGAKEWLGLGLDGQHTMLIVMEQQAREISRRRPRPRRRWSQPVPPKSVRAQETPPTQEETPKSQTTPEQEEPPKSETTTPQQEETPHDEPHPPPQEEESIKTDASADEVMRQMAEWDQFNALREAHEKIQVENHRKLEKFTQGFQKEQGATRHERKLDHWERRYEEYTSSTGAHTVMQHDVDKALRSIYIDAKSEDDLRKWLRTQRSSTDWSERAKQPTDTFDQSWRFLMHGIPTKDVQEKWVDAWRNVKGGVADFRSTEPVEWKTWVNQVQGVKKEDPAVVGHYERSVRLAMGPVPERVLPKMLGMKSTQSARAHDPPAYEPYPTGYDLDTNHPKWVYKPDGASHDDELRMISQHVDENGILHEKWDWKVPKPITDPPLRPKVVMPRPMKYVSPSVIARQMEEIEREVAVHKRIVPDFDFTVSECVSLKDLVRLRRGLRSITRERIQELSLNSPNTPPLGELTDVGRLEYLVRTRHAEEDAAWSALLPLAPHRAQEPFQKWTLMSKVALRKTVELEVVTTDYKRENESRIVSYMGASSVEDALNTLRKDMDGVMATDLSTVWEVFQDRLAGARHMNEELRVLIKKTGIEPPPLVPGIKLTPLLDQNVYLESALHDKIARGSLDEKTCRAILTPMIERAHEALSHFGKPMPAPDASVSLDALLKSYSDLTREVSRLSSIHTEASFWRDVTARIVADKSARHANERHEAMELLKLIPSSLEVAALRSRLFKGDAVNALVPEIERYVRNVLDQEFEQVQINTGVVDVQWSRRLLPDKRARLQEWTKTYVEEQKTIINGMLETFAAESPYFAQHLRPYYERCIASIGHEFGSTGAIKTLHDSIVNDRGATNHILATAALQHIASGPVMTSLPDAVLERVRAFVSQGGDPNELQDLMSTVYGFVAQHYEDQSSSLKEWVSEETWKRISHPPGNVMEFFRTLPARTEAYNEAIEAFLSRHWNVNDHVRRHTRENVAEVGPEVAWAGLQERVASYVYGPIPLEAVESLKDHPKYAYEYRGPKTSFRFNGLVKDGKLHWDAGSLYFVDEHGVTVRQEGTYTANAFLETGSIVVYKPGLGTSIEVLEGGRVVQVEIHDHASGSKLVRGSSFSFEAGQGAWSIRGSTNELVLKTEKGEEMRVTGDGFSYKAQGKDVLVTGNNDLEVGVIWSQLLGKARHYATQDSAWNEETAGRLRKDIEESVHRVVSGGQSAPEINRKEPLSAKDAEDVNALMANKTQMITELLMRLGSARSKSLITFHADGSITVPDPYGTDGAVLDIRMVGNRVKTVLDEDKVLEEEYDQRLDWTKHKSVHFLKAISLLGVVPQGHVQAVAALADLGATYLKASEQYKTQTRQTDKVKVRSMLGLDTAQADTDVSKESPSYDVPQSYDVLHPKFGVDPSKESEREVHVVKVHEDVILDRGKDQQQQDRRVGKDKLRVQQIRLGHIDKETRTTKSNANEQAKWRVYDTDRKATISDADHKLRVLYTLVGGKDALSLRNDPKQLHDALVKGTAHLRAPEDVAVAKGVLKDLLPHDKVFSKSGGLEKALESWPGLADRVEQLIHLTSSKIDMRRVDKGDRARLVEAEFNKVGLPLQDAIELAHAEGKLQNPGDQVIFEVVDGKVVTPEAPRSTQEGMENDKKTRPKADDIGRTAALNNAKDIVHGLFLNPWMQGHYDGITGGVGDKVRDFLRGEHIPGLLEQVMARTHLDKVLEPHEIAGLNAVVQGEFSRRMQHVTGDSIALIMTNLAPGALSGTGMAKLASAGKWGKHVSTFYGGVSTARKAWNAWTMATEAATKLVLVQKKLLKDEDFKKLLDVRGEEDKPVEPFLTPAQTQEFAHRLKTGEITQEQYELDTAHQAQLNRYVLLLQREGQFLAKANTLVEAIGVEASAPGAHET